MPEEDEAALLAASQFMDGNECDTVIAAAQLSAGRTTEEVRQALREAEGRFRADAGARFGRKGEW